MTINTIKGEKRTDLFYPIPPHKKIAVVSMLSNNLQYCLKGSVNMMMLKTREELVLDRRINKGKELDSLIGQELKSTMIDSHDNVLRTSKSDNVTKMTIILKELNNSDTLEDGRPSNTFFTYYVTSPEYFRHFEPAQLHLYDLSVGKYLVNKYALWLNFRTIDENELYGMGRQIGNTLEGITIQVEKKAEASGALKAYIYLIMDAQLNIKDGAYISVVY